MRVDSHCFTTDYLSFEQPHSASHCFPIHQVFHAGGRGMTPNLLFRRKSQTDVTGRHRCWHVGRVVGLGWGVGGGSFTAGVSIETTTMVACAFVHVLARVPPNQRTQARAHWSRRVLHARPIAAPRAAGEETRRLRNNAAAADGKWKRYVRERALCQWTGSGSDYVLASVVSKGFDFIAEHHIKNIIIESGVNYIYGQV